MAWKVSVKPHMLVFYRGSGKQGYERHEIKEENRTPKGQLSVISVRKMKNAIGNLALAAKVKNSYNPKFKTYYKWKLNLITLTLPVRQCFSDAEFRRFYLNHFLIEFVRKYNPVGYVVRLEAQENGNIHAHIVSDVYIDKDALRHLWNRILSKGSMIDDFEKVHGHRDPNSTDVHSVKDIRNIEAYMTKYMTKKAEKERRLIEGKLWSCSKNLMQTMNLGADEYEICDCENQVSMGNLREVHTGEDFLRIFVSTDKKSAMEYFLTETERQKYIKSIIDNSPLNQLLSDPDTPLID